jgi:hypothetical protein
MVVVPAPVAARLWFVVPFLLVPLLAPALAPVTEPATLLARRPWWSVVAGVAAAGAFAAPMGTAAAGALAIPWLVLTILNATAVSWSFAGARSPEALIGGIAAIFLAVGGAFLVQERVGFDPMAFGPTIALLTMVHFSVAGFALVAIAGLLARSGSRAAMGGAVGLAAGIPMTAVGWMLGTPIAAWPGSVVVAVGGVLVAAGIAAAPGAWRGGRAGAALALGAGMVLAIGWSTALAWGVPYLDLETMVRSHGVLNLGAVLVASIALTAPGRTVVRGTVLSGWAR